jgi:formylglycine-generating enzyme required for sulfatase activity/tRNA A-37 threonylcarbamoyl transferase component Bud32
MDDPVARLNQALEGRYRIQGEIGQGGMATVYLADDVKHERKVALKVLKPELAAVLGGERFLGEIKTTANLRHPHILPLFDSGEADGFLYYVMPFVQGESLRERLERDGRLPVDEALSITTDVAAALSYAHGKGIVHRDIKPANVLLEDGEALVADFGIALAVSGAHRTQLTATGLSLGTPAYMSPEQIGGETSVDGRSDVYSLGCLLFEMLTGEAPYSGPSVQAIVAKALSDPVPSSRERRPEIPKVVDSAITRALAKRPEDRFETPREMSEACAAIRPSGPGRRASRMALGISAVAVAVLGFFGWRAIQVSNARSSLLEASTLADGGNFVEAYALATEAEQWIPDHPTLGAQMPIISNLLTVRSNPEGAEVSLQRFPENPGESTEALSIGVTPIIDYRVPRADHRIVVSLDGFLPIERIASTELAREGGGAGEAHRVTFSLELDPTESVPPEMVRVPGGEYELMSPDAPTGMSVPLQDFLIDRHEVTNGAFQEFLRGGGYPADAHWGDTPDGLKSGFVDRTGLAGPRGWVRQGFPEDEAPFPVTGISRYEASAYCRSLGKRLPTVYEWEKTARDGQISHRGVLMPWGLMTSAGSATRRSNFASDGPTAVDAFPFGVSPYGAYGMAGNVREWTANPFGDGFAVTGGSWEGPSYLYTEYASAAVSFSSAALGFRCAKSLGSGDQGIGKIDLDTRSPVYTPVDEATYRTLLAHYQYDRQPPKPRLVDTVEMPSWTRERIWIDGPATDSILLYFYAPKTSNPPYQTIVYVPGSGAFCCQTLPEEMEWAIGPVIQGGRAVLAVVLKGMIEREFDPGFLPPEPSSVRFRDLMVQQATELRLGIDYVEARGDVDPDRLAYVAVSFGAGSRLGFSVVDDRYKAVVYIGGGIDERVKPTLPEADNVNFAPYLSVPKLLLNGRSDEEHPWLTRGLPLWNLLREPKELVLLDGGGHVVPLETRIPAINDFLDRTLGPTVSR